MKCSKVKKILSNYMDGGIEPALQADLESHLKQCDGCAQELNDFRKTDELVKLKAAEHPSDEYWAGYWPRLKDKLEESPSSSPLLAPEPVQQRRLFPVFLPRFSLVLNAALVILLIVSARMLYCSNRQINKLKITLSQKDPAPKIIPQTKALIPLHLASQDISEQLLRKQLKLFYKVKDMFPKTIRWVVSSNGNVDLGLANSRLLQEAFVKEESLIFIQFRILRHTQTTEVVSSPMIMVYSGNEVNTKLNGLSKTDQAIYRYQCLPNLKPDGSIELMTRMVIDGTVLETTLLAKEGEKTELGRLRKQDAEYSIDVTICSSGLKNPGTKTRQI